MKKRIAALFLCGTMMGTLQPVWANEITAVTMDDLMQVTGSLQDEDEGVLVNLWMSRTETGEAVIVRQTRTDNTGGYNFSINLEEAVQTGGKFQVKTIAQTEDSDVWDTEIEFYTEKEMEPIYAKLVEYQQDADRITELLKEKENQLSFADSNLRMLLASGKAEEIAAFLTTETLSKENCKQILRYIAVVKTIEHATDGSAVEEVIERNTALLELDTNAVYQALSAADYVNFGHQLAASSAAYQNRSDFIADVEEKVILAELYAARGTDGLLNRLRKYDTKLSFSVFDSADNQTAVLKNILEAAEKGSITDLETLQKLLDTPATETSSGGGTGSGGGGGAGVSAGAGITGGYQAQNELLTQEPFDETAIVEPDVIDFQDMDGHSWAAESVDALAALGIINGYSNTEFAPDGVLTRAEFCKLLCGALNISASNQDTGFADVGAEDWFCGYVWGLCQEGIITGMDPETFSPDTAITRQDVCTILYRALKKEGVLQASGTDVQFLDEQDISDYAKEAVKALAKVELLKGSDGSCFPQASMTRAEAAVLVYRVYAYRNGGTV
ncbi:MAG: S-layer homology domain-containing protein [Clostridia bacterium]|nr:S-layer homology domain-containing protein [Clostridia bacterium]